jgi:hypothetical protein
MRASPELRPHLLAARMARWLDIARCPIINIRVPTWKARRNYRALVRRYPQIAAALGYTEAMSYASPLHALQQQEWSGLPLDSNLPARENNPPEPPECPMVANNSVRCRVIENHPAPPPAAGAPRHLGTMEDEAL